jgi:hypothetical protein
LSDDEPGIFVNQALELLIVGGVLGHQFDLVGRNVGGEGFALFAALEVVIGPIGSLAHDTEFARFHVLDFGDFLEDLSSVRWFHRQKYIPIYILRHKKNAI